MSYFEFQSLEESLQKKRQALEKWIELLNWISETNQHIEHVAHEFQAGKPANEIDTELSKLVSEVNSWKPISIATDEICTTSGVSIQGKSAVAEWGEIKKKIDQLR